jgi:hypothetical protein
MQLKETEGKKTTFGSPDSGTLEKVLTGSMFSGYFIKSVSSLLSVLGFYPQQF